MVASLDTRVVRILRWLLDQSRPRSTANLGDALGLSQRVVRYRLDAVESFLASRGLTLVRQRGSGLYVEGPDDVRASVKAELSEHSAAPRVYAREERERILISSLLQAAPDPTSLEELGKALEVSKASARRDLKRAEEWLLERDLLLTRLPGVGVAVVGSESRVRQAMVQLLIASVPEEVLLELCDKPISESLLAHVRVPAGLRDRLEGLDLHRTSGLLTERIFPEALAERNSELVLSLYLAVAASRLRAGHELVMERGRHRSLADHPVALTAGRLARAFAEEFGYDLPDAEVAGITEYLLGLAAVAGDEDTDLNHHDQLLEAITGVAADELHATLRDDTELRRGLAQHLDRLAVRLKYGLPVHNPLLSEVRDRYPDVYAVAAKIGAILSERFGLPVNDDEVGYITMYLSGAMERTRLRPTSRAYVVCPSGVATAWVLVSRIKAEFPQLELMNVMSARAFDALEARDADLVISTVPIEPCEIPIVVVSPLLIPEDVRRLSRYV